MNKIVQKIEDLRTQISYINFQDHLSQEDYERMDKLNLEIKELEKQLKGVKGVAVRCTSISGGYSFYLTNNSILCCGDKPTIFESEEEAQDYLDKARIVPSEYKIEFIEMSY